MSRLNATKNQVAEELVKADESGDWQAVIDAVKEGFRVERVTLYTMRHGYLEHKCTSACDVAATPIDNRHLGEPFGVLRPLVYLGKELCISDPDDYQLAQWPNHTGVRTLCALRVGSPNMGPVGVLEFVNRIPDHDHPHEVLGFDEREACAGRRTCVRGCHGPPTTKICCRKVR